MENIVLIGAGQHCEVVLYNIAMQDLFHPVAVLDADVEKWGTTIHSVPVVGTYDKKTLDELSAVYQTKNFIISFGAMKYRKSVYNQMLEFGWNPVNVIHPSAVVSPWAKIGKGVLIEAGSLIAPNPVIGDNVVLNMGAQVNHDNTVGDHVFIASTVILSGGVSVGENTLLDDGVIISKGHKVGKNCLIGAGAVVTHDIEDGYICYGNPARIIRKNDKF